MNTQVENITNMNEEDLYNLFMDFVVDKNRNRDLLDEVLFQLFIKNPEKYIDDYYFTMYVNDNVRNKIIDYILENQLPLKLLNKFSINADNPRKNSIYQKIYEMSKEGIYNLEEYSYYENVCNLFDHMYVLEKDINNITKITSKYPFMMKYFDEMLDFCHENNYSFSDQDKDFLDLLFSEESWRYCPFLDFETRCSWRDHVLSFFEKASYSKEVCSKAIQKLYLTKETEFDDNNYIFKIIKSILNKYPEYITDYEFKFIFHNKDIDPIKVDEFLEMIKILKDNNCSIRLTVDYPDFSFLDKVEDIMGDSIFVKPIRGAEKAIKWDEGFYTIEELRTKDKVIDRYAKVLDGNGDKKISPFEKFVASYIIVTNFAPYKEEKQDYFESRSVYEFIDKVTDTRIVCVGYSNFLIELLSRSGMEDDINIHLVHSSGESSKSDDNHAVAVVHIKDPKYNMDLVNISDPTNDSVKGLIEKRNLRHMLMNKECLLEDTNKYPNGEKDFHLEEKDLERIEKKLHVTNISEMLNQSVSEEQIILALCAINCYVDRNRKMPLTNDISETGYSIQDYNEAVLQLGLYDKFVLEDKYQNKSFQELCEVLDEEYRLDKGEVRDILTMRLKSQLNDNLFLEVNDSEVTVKYEFNAINYIKNYSEEEQEMLFDHFKDEIVSVRQFSMRVPILTFSINDSISDVMDRIVIDEDKIIGEITNKFDEVIKGKGIKNI